MLGRLNIGVKLPVVTVLVALLTLVLVEVTANFNAQATVMHAGRERLTAVAESRAAEVLLTLTKIRNDLSALADTQVTLEAARAFVTSWQLHVPDQETDLRRIFVSENPNPPNWRHLLVRPRGETSAYSLVHARYQRYFASQIGDLGFANLYLISPEGTVVYSVAKRDAFARRIAGPVLRGSALERAFHTALESDGNTIDIMTQFERWPLYPDRETAILATPIKSPLGTVEAVLAIRVSARIFDPTMIRPAGLGRSGESFLVTEGMQSITRSRGAARPVLRTGDRMAAPVREVLAGRRGVQAHPGDDGRDIVSAFVPVNFMGHGFGVLAQQKQAEILAPARAMRAKMFDEGLVILAFVSVLGLVLARSMSVPLTRLGEAMRQISDRNLDADIMDRKRGDEIGIIARRLDKFRATLIEAESLTRENAFKGAAFESASAAIMLVDRELNIIYVNESLVGLFGSHVVAVDRLVPHFRLDAIVGTSLLAFFPGAERGRAALASHRQFSEEIRLGQACLSIRMGAVEAEEGNVLGYVVEWEDVSARRGDRTILEVIGSRIPVAGLSADGRLLSANSAFEDWFGLQEFELVGLSWDRLFGVHGTLPDERTDWNSIGARLADGRTLTLCPRDRPDRRIDATLSAVTGDTGRTQQIILIGLGGAPVAPAAVLPSPRSENATAKQ